MTESQRRLSGPAPSARSIYFIGICGTAMAATAAALKEKGFSVSGSDENVYPPMSDFLDARGIRVNRGYRPDHLAPPPELVVIGNAFSRGNPEVEAVLAQKLRYCSLPELLQEYFIRGKRSIVVCGTHGKTTTTSLLAWVFASSGLNPSFLIGGLPSNFGQGARFTGGDWIIIEGDEYDTAFFDKRSKFVHYLPELAIINNLEFDHADIFDSLAAVQSAFWRFVQLLPGNGKLFVNGDDPNIAPLLDFKFCPIEKFGFNPGNAHRAQNIQLRELDSEFEVDGARYRLPLPGELNIRNALGVISVARHCGLSPEQIQAAFASFLGIKRRLEVRGVAGDITIIDDFGHHPTAVAETIKALRVRYPRRRLWAVFEPRSNTTRRNIFQRELAAALGTADAVVLSRVARLEQLPPDQRLDPERLLTDIRALGRPAAYPGAVPEIVEHLAASASAGDVICIFSNGGFGGIHDLLLARLASPKNSPSL